MIGPNTNKFKTVNMPNGVHDMFSLMGFLTDPNKFKKHLEELKKFTDEANQAVENVAKASEIETLLASTKSKNEAASTVVGEAQAQVDSILKEATESIAKDKEQTRILLTQVTEEKEKYTLLSKAKATELKEREANLAKAENELAARVKGLDQRESAVKRDQILIAEKKSILANL